MATRAQRFKFRQEIKQTADKPKAAPKARRERVASEGEAAKNNYADTGAHATYEQETSALGSRPSRRSTRRASNHSKTDSQLRRRQTRRAGSAKTRATKAAARKTGK